MPPKQRTDDLRRARSYSLGDSRSRKKADGASSPGHRRKAKKQREQQQHRSQPVDDARPSTATGPSASPAEADTSIPFTMSLSTEGVTYGSQPPTPPDAPLTIGRPPGGFRCRASSPAGRHRTRVMTFRSLEGDDAPFSDLPPLDARARSPGPGALATPHSGSGFTGSLTPSASAPMFSLAVTPPEQAAGSAYNVIRSRRASNATLSRGNSATASPSDEALPGPGSGPTSRSGSRRASRLEQRNQILEQHQEALEASIARRNSDRDPGAVRAKRLAELVVQALVAQRWLEQLPSVVEAERRRAHALDVLRSRFVPLWRRYRRRREANARFVVGRFVLRWVAQVRIRKRRVAADRIVSFLKNQAAQFQRCCWTLRTRVVALQRAVRLMQRRREAQVELHMRRIRNERDPAASLELAYWRDVGRKSGFVTKANWYDAAVDPSAIPRIPEAVIRRRLLVAVGRAARQYHRDIIAWETKSEFTCGRRDGASANELRHQLQTASGSFRLSLQPSDSLTRDAVSPLMATINSMATTSPSGQFSPAARTPAFPDDAASTCSASVLGSTVTGADGYAPPGSSRSISHEAPSVATAMTPRGLPSFRQPTASAGAENTAPSSSGVRHSLTTLASLAQLSRLRQPRYTAMLPRATIMRLLDDCCAVTAVTKNDPRWRKHLDAAADAQQR